MSKYQQQTCHKRVSASGFALAGFVPEEPARNIDDLSGIGVALAAGGPRIDWRIKTVVLGQDLPIVTNFGPATVRPIEEVCS